MTIRMMGQMTTVVLAGMLFLTGCMSINAPKTVTFGGKGKGEDKKIRKSDAVDIARRLVRDEGKNAENFDIADQKTDNGWWICFDHKTSGYKLGWPYHFAVRVTLDGKATLYKSRE